MDEFGDCKFDVTKYVWYKFYDYTQISEQVGEMKVTDDIYCMIALLLRMLELKWMCLLSTQQTRSKL